MKNQYKMGEDLQKMLQERKDSMAFFTDDYRPLNMYIILLEDLEMDTGKMISQAGHGFDMCHDKAKLLRPEITSQYKGSGNGTKVVMKAKNLYQLERGYRACLAANIPCEMVIDRGTVSLPHFTGEPIFTALAIGPAYKDEVTQITKLYSMLKI